LIEVLLGAAVIAIVAVLGTNPPGLHQDLASPAAQAPHHSH
jgi:hypothetical protein